MLDYAIRHADKLKELYMSNVLSNREFYKYWNYDSYYGFKWPEMEDNEWSTVKRVSIFEGKVFGYFSASIARVEMQATSVSALYLHPNTLSVGFVRDFEYFVETLFTEHHMNKVSFICVFDNPAKSMYFAYIKKHGGCVVGIRRKEVMLTDGVLHDVILFEILKEEWRK